jgi:hypothetical protein
MYASPSNTRGKSHVREIRPRGSVRGALSNGRPYRNISPRLPRYTKIDVDCYREAPRSGFDKV